MRVPALMLVVPLLLSACNETTAATMRPSSDQNPQLQLLARVNSLEAEVAGLRNTVEVQAEELNKLRERLSSFYDDIDQRLQSLESGSAAGTYAPVPAAATVRDSEIPAVPQQVDVPGNVISPADRVGSAAAISAAPVAAELSAASPGVSEKEAASELEQATYDRAFDLLKQSRYEEAVAAFKEFQTRYSHSTLADNAQYWVAEARYVNRAYDAALHEYSALIQRYPESKRLPDAMLKVGYIHFDNEQWQQARRALNAVVIRYPGTRVAVSAKMRLDQMTKTGH
jgi:tol-pal system protein YbgF